MNRDRSANRPPPADGDEQRILWTRAIIAGGCAAGLALCPRLWCGPRLYPRAPVWSGLPELPPALTAVLYALMFAGLAAIIIWRRSGWPVAAFVGLAAVWSLWDQSRWQPWTYQYVCMLACLGLAGRGEAVRAGGLNACRLIVAGTYFWSGVQKANASFVHTVYPWLVEPFVGREVSSLTANLAYAIPLVEAAVGLALLVPRLRNVAAGLICLMHGMIMLSIGPWGHDWNTVVWPWNIAMPLATIVLFARSPHVSFRELLWGRGAWVQRLALLAFGIMPMLSFWGLWDAYLSASLYSGNTLKGYLEISAEARQRLPPEAQAVCENAARGRYRLPLSDWSTQDLNVPAYPAERVIHAVFAGFARRIARPGEEVQGIILTRPAWPSTDRQEIHIKLSPPPERKPGGG